MPPEIAEAFSRHAFTEVYPYLDEAVQWTIVGHGGYRGRAEVVDACEESAQYLEDVLTNFSKFKLVEGEACVVIDTEAEYIETSGEASYVASCDLYDFSDGKLTAITSYTFELEPGHATS